MVVLLFFKGGYIKVLIFMLLSCFFFFNLSFNFFLRNLKYFVRIVKIIIQGLKIVPVLINKPQVN